MFGAADFWADGPTAFLGESHDLAGSAPGELGQEADPRAGLGGSGGGEAFPLAAAAPWTHPCKLFLQRGPGSWVLTS